MNVALLVAIVSSLFVAGTCAASSNAPGQSAEEVQSTASPFELRSGVIIDPKRGEAYLMNPHHGIDAIALASGKLIWSTTAGAKPLTVVDDRLVAQAENPGDARVLSIVVLDAKSSGQPVFKSALPLPKGVFASIDDGLGTSFIVSINTVRPRSASSRVQPNSLLLLWRFSQRTISGIAHRGPPEERQTRGAARIDLDTGRVVPLKTIPEPIEFDGGQVPPNLQHLAESGALPGAPQRAGQFFIASEPTGSGERTTVRRWDAVSGRERANIELDPGFGVAFPSADGQLLLANKPIGADATGRQNYLWSIYSLETGQRVAETRMPTSAAQFFIWRSILVYESGPYGQLIDGKWTAEPLELRAVDLKTNVEAWKVPLRDTAYHGPFPPRP